MIYIEIIDNKPTRSTSFEQIGKNYQNVITTDYEDYTVNNRKYIFENGEVKLNPNWEEEQLNNAKQAKYNEANSGAKTYLESGEALFEFEPNKHIEATDGNIAKLTAYALAFVTGQLQPTDTVVWNTKEDETVELNQEQIVTIINGLGTVQALVWSVQFPQYVQAIETAETVEEVEAIEIIYTSEIPQEETDV